MRLRHFLIGGGLVTLVGLLAWLIVLDRNVARMFEDYRQAFPSQILSKPMPLLSGQHLSPEKLNFWLTQAGYQRKANPRNPGEFSEQGGSYLIFSRGFTLKAQQTPPQTLRLVMQGDVLGQLAVNGVSQMQAQLEPLVVARIFPNGGEDRERLKLSDTPQFLIDALLATEDRDFYEHWGVKPTSIARAAFANLMAGRVVQGGSTLTQQLIKNYFLTKERSFSRKFKEIAMAFALERQVDKQAILEAYLNEVFLAQTAGRAIHGFALASQTFFCKPAQNLTLAQAALLVGMVKGPSYYHPVKHPERAKTRRDLVLRLMAEQGSISLADAEKAQTQPLGVKSCQTTSSAYADYVDLVKNELSARYPLEALQKSRLSIYTALDPWQHYQMAQSTAKEMRALEAKSQKDLETAFVLVDHSQGEVTAVLGHDPNQTSFFNRALNAQRNIGSLIKPVIFATAFAKPDAYRLDDLIEDVPYRLKDERNEWWEPKNYDGAYGGEVTFEQALVHSRNIPAVKLGVELGLEQVKGSLKALGYDLQRPFYPSDLLGSISLSPLEVAQIYQTLAAGGFNAPLKTLREVRDSEGQLVERQDLVLDEALPRQGVYLVNYLLHQVTQWGTAKSLTWRIPGRDFAGKTGTTNDGRDAWFAGFDGKHLGVVWVGQDDNAKSQLTGGGAALPVWAGVFKNLPNYPLALNPPYGVCGQPPYWSEKDCQR